MAVPVNLNFTPLTDTVIWFATVDAFNQFMASITVNIAPGNLPEAAILTRGVVFQSPAVFFVDPASVPSYVSLATEEGVTEIPSKAFVLSLLSRIDELSDSYRDLLIKLKAAGVVANS